MLKVDLIIRNNVHVSFSQHLSQNVKFSDTRFRLKYYCFLRLLNKMNDDCKIYKKYSKVILSPPGTAATGEVVTTGLMTRVSHPILVTVYLVNLLGLFIVLFYSLHEIPKQMAC